MAAKKKVTTKKAPAKKTTKKASSAKPVKKAPASKAAKKAPAKKAPAKKTPTAKKAPAKKATAKKAPAKKAPAKKVAAPKASKKAATTKAPAAKAGKESTPAPAEKKVHKRKKAAAEELNGELVAKAAAPAKPVKPVKLTQFAIKQRQNLLDLRDELMDAMYGVQQEALRNGPQGSEASGSGMHQGDAGSDAYDRDFALNLLSKEQDALSEIEAALKRVEAGTYGVCEMSGKKIPQARLEAIPFARLTVECQTIWEKDFPNRSFRNSDSIGYGEEARNGGSLVSLDAGD